MRSRVLVVLTLLCVAIPAAAATIDTTDMRLLRMPDIHGDQVVFVHGGDLWTVSAQGGEARRLTSHVGNERFPRFSPDGRSIAFTGDYDGNTDVFVIPATGGEPRRLTWHPGVDQVVDWQPDGERIRFRSSRDLHQSQEIALWTVDVDGGLPERMILPNGGLSSYAPDGKRMAYNRISREHRTWKRYKGGMAQDVWIFDFASNSAERVTDWVGTDNFPMWHGDTIYFTSDREDGRLQVWAHDLTSGEEHRVTNHKDYDVKYPGLGGDAVVYENGGWLYVLDLATEKTRRLQVSLHDDRIHARESLRKVQGLISSASLAPGAKRVAFSARGEIFTVPAEKGAVRNLTNTSGVRERAASWSPDGKWLAYLSDLDGEYQVYVRPADGKGEAKALTKDLRNWVYNLIWSPDSERLLFYDAGLGLHMVERDGGKTTRIDESPRSPLSDISWSPDSRWVAYAKVASNDFASLYLYDVEEGESHRITDGAMSDHNPVFDPDGKYLYFWSQRHFNPTIGNHDLKPIYTNMDGLYLLTLAADTEHPFAPESDEVEDEDEDADKDEDEDADKKDEDEDGDKEKDEDKVEATRIDLAGLGDRVIPLDVPPGNYWDLQAASGKLFYQSRPTRPGQPPASKLNVFMMEDRETKTVLESADGYELAPGGDKILYTAGGAWGIVDAAPEQKPAEKPLRVAELKSRVDPRNEWPQIFREGWRLQRDFFYDPDLHRVDWDDAYDRYSELVPYVSHRSDLDYILGEMIAELNCSHAYVRATGDYPEIPRLGTGLLGCDLVLDTKAERYRFAKVFGLRDWNGGTPAPLAEPGSEVTADEYLLAVDGVPVTAGMNPYALFEDRVGTNVVLEVGADAGGKDSREITVKPIVSERNLRYTDWAADRAQRVAELSDGRIGYIHLPNTAIGGMQAFAEGYYPQLDKEALLIDERYNGGGWPPDFIMGILRQQLLHTWKRRYGETVKVPGTTFLGHLAMLTNHMAGSGGDALPYYFQQYELGPVIGTRSWGGLVGYSRRITLMDGGWLTFPEFGIVSLDGEFVVENHGVDPDVVVDNLPQDVIAGRDPQLERAVELLLRKIEDEPVPVYEPGPFPRDRN